MNHLVRSQRRMQIKLTPVVRNGGQLQPLESEIMILVQKPGDLVRQEYLPSLPASPRKMLSCLRAS